jgi:hypothetical protein
MMTTEKYGKVALVTGASSGIGEAFTRALVANGFDVVAVARRREKLEALEQELAGKGRGRVIPMWSDLSQPGAAVALYTELASRGISIDVLVNNAGFGLLGGFEVIDRDRSVGMVELNCRTVVDLTHTFLPPMKERGRGAVIIVSSVVGAIPAPWFSVYGATKSFDLYFGEALYGECKGTGVDVLTVLPGLTRTEFQAGAGMRNYHAPYRGPDQVVSTAFSAIGRKAIVVDGWMNKLAVHGSRFLPRCMLLPLSRFVMRSELGNAVVKHTGSRE